MRRTISILTIGILAAGLSAFGQNSNQAPAQPQICPKMAARGGRAMGRGMGPGMGRPMGRAMGRGMRTGTCQGPCANNAAPAQAAPAPTKQPVFRGDSAPNRISDLELAGVTRYETLRGRF